MEGWIKIYRAIFQWEWFDDEKMVKFFISLILLANHEAAKWHGITIERGQFITTLDKLAAQLNFSKQQVRTMLSKLESSGEITHQSTHHYSVITVCEYDNYQCMTTDNKHTEQHTNNTQITHNQHTNNTQITHNKNDNNDKNDKNENNDKKSSNVKFTPPTLEEVRAYCKEINSIINAEDWMDYYTSNGFKVSRNPMKDWKATVRRWDREERKKKLSSAPQKPTMTLDVNKYWNIKN